MSHNGTLLYCKGFTFTGKIIFGNGSLIGCQGDDGPEELYDVVLILDWIADLQQLNGVIDAKVSSFLRFGPIIRSLKKLVKI